VNALVLYSYAKLNLYLEVLNRRKDNYHNLITVFERINLADKIILKPRPDKKINIICQAHDVPKDNSNLCYASAKLLQDKFHIDSGLDIKIIKRIPVSAGLGGGSGNAAAVLLGLNRLWKLNLSQDRLATLAKGIGCDVPFFVYNTAFAKGLGRGDRIKVLNGPKNIKFWHIVVVPKIKVATPFIYKKYDAYSKMKPILPHIGDACARRAGLTRSKYNVNIFPLALKKKDPFLMSGLLFNSLERITFKLHPQLERIKELLSGLGLKSILMSGSGPAVFGIVSSRKEAVSLSRKLKKEHSSWQIYAVSTF